MCCYFIYSSLQSFVLADQERSVRRGFMLFHNLQNLHSVNLGCVTTVILGSNHALNLMLEIGEGPFQTTLYKKQKRQGKERKVRIGQNWDKCAPTWVVASFFVP